MENEEDEISILQQIEKIAHKYSHEIGYITTQTEDTVKYHMENDLDKFLETLNLLSKGYWTIWNLIKVLKKQEKQPLSSEDV